MNDCKGRKGKTLLYTRYKAEGEYANYRGAPEHWTDVKPLGRGGSATVWLCYDGDKDCLVARKTIWPRGVSFFVYALCV